MFWDTYIAFVCILWYILDSVWSCSYVRILSCCCWFLFKQCVRHGNKFKVFFLMCLLFSFWSLVVEYFRCFFGFFFCKSEFDQLVYVKVNVAIYQFFLYVFFFFSFLNLDRMHTVCNIYAWEMSYKSLENICPTVQLGKRPFFLLCRWCPYLWRLCEGICGPDLWSESYRWGQVDLFFMGKSSITTFFFFLNAGDKFIAVAIRMLIQDLY